MTLCPTARSACGVLAAAVPAPAIFQPFPDCRSCPASKTRRSSLGRGYLALTPRVGDVVRPECGWPFQALGRRFESCPGGHTNAVLCARGATAFSFVTHGAGVFRVERTCWFRRSRCPVDQASAACRPHASKLGLLRVSRVPREAGRPWLSQPLLVVSAVFEGDDLGVMRPPNSPCASSSVRYR